MNLIRISLTFSYIKYIYYFRTTDMRVVGAKGMYSDKPIVTTSSQIEDSKHTLY